MSKHFYSHLNSAKSILNIYNGEEPFHLFIKKYFSNNKKFGSKDRKQITALCYFYFRLGHASRNISIEEKIILGAFLSENKSSTFFETLKPEFNNIIEKPLEEKLLFIKDQFNVDAIFPFANELCEGINKVEFNKSFLIQPYLFLRIRPGFKKQVIGKLTGAGITYKTITDDCIALPNGSKIEDVIKIDKEAVVQDYNSQRTGELIKLSFANREFPIDIWDCCAASGGKSLLAYDINPKIDLTVSDKRESILQNLHERFNSAGIKNYRSFVIDLENETSEIPPHQYDLIICDAPCTGSGTWARTPEQLYYFKKDAIEKYANLQKKILEKVVTYLKPGGHILYITCSDFKRENEDVLEFANEKLQLKKMKVKLFAGYEMRADTLFAALLQKTI